MDTRIFPLHKLADLLIVIRHSGSTRRETVNSRICQTVFLKVEIFIQVIHQKPSIAI